MDYYDPYSSDFGPDQQGIWSERERSRNRFASAAIALGILSCCLSLIFYLSIPMGALAIIMALLSKGGKRRMTSRARFAVGAGAMGMIFSLIITVYSVYTVMNDPFYRSYVEQYLNYISGTFDPADPDGGYQSLDELLNPFSVPEEKVVEPAPVLPDGSV